MGRRRRSAGGRRGVAPARHVHRRRAGVRVDRGQILENEHQVTDLVDQCGLLLSDALQDVPGGAGIHPVEQFGDRLHPAVGLPAELP